MQLPENDVVNDIIQYIRNSNTLFNMWYVGIAEDPVSRLFEEHKVVKDADYWIFRECFSADAARRVEQFFISQYKTDGDSGGGSDTSRFVYAYKKESHTNDE